MEPINWFMKVVTQHYFDFDGRARRAEFWWFFLVWLIIYVVLAVIGNLVHLSTMLAGLFALAVFLPYLGVGVRRLHDINRSGWWILIGFVPLVGALLLIYWYVQPGTPGKNDYGLDPKATAVATA